jgi:hypothetical protein
MKQVFKVIMVTACTIGLCIGLYFGGWWLTNDSTNRNAKINQNSYNRQNGLETAILQQMVDYSRLDDGDQKTVVGDKICIEISQLKNPLPIIVSWKAKTCS